MISIIFFKFNVIFDMWKKQILMAASQEQIRWVFDNNLGMIFVTCISP